MTIDDIARLEGLPNVDEVIVSPDGTVTVVKRGPAAVQAPVIPWADPWIAPTFAPPWDGRFYCDPQQIR